jgi:hypothetical protein
MSVSECSSALGTVVQMGHGQNGRKCVAGHTDIQRIVGIIIRISDLSVGIYCHVK